MPLSGEAKIGLALTLVLAIGAGLIAIFPDQHIYGWGMISISGAGLVVLGVHHFWGLRNPTPQRLLKTKTEQQTEEMLAKAVLMEAERKLLKETRAQNRALKSGVESQPAKSLSLSFDLDDPACLVRNTIITIDYHDNYGKHLARDQVPCDWYRIKVANTSDVSVTGARGKLIRILRDGVVALDVGPIDLPFALASEPDAANKTIDQHVPAYLDLAYISHPDNRLALGVLDLSKLPSAADSSRVFDQPGEYAFEVVVLSSARSERYTATLAWDGLRKAGAAQQESKEDEFVALDEAGRWLYEHASEAIKEVLRSGVPETFHSIGEHGGILFRSAAIDHDWCKLYARREPGLPMEEIEPHDFSAFESLFGGKRPFVDVSVKRSSLGQVLAHYEESHAAYQANVLKKK